MKKKNTFCILVTFMLLLCCSGCNDFANWKVYVESGFDSDGKPVISEMELRTGKASDDNLQDIDEYKFVEYNTHKMYYSQSDYIGYYKSKIDYYVNDDGNTFGFDSKSGDIKDIRSLNGIPINTILGNDVVQDKSIETAAKNLATHLIDVDDYLIEYKSLVLLKGQDEKAEYCEYRYEKGLYTPNSNESVIEYRATFYKEYEGIRSSDLVQISFDMDAQLLRLIVGDLNGYVDKREIPTPEMVGVLIDNKVAETTEMTDYVISSRPMLFLNEQDEVIVIVNTEVSESEGKSSESFMYIIAQ